jgi:hypothetical protein
MQIGGVDCKSKVMIEQKLTPFVIVVFRNDQKLCHPTVQKLSTYNATPI